ncbi:hypothetical protein GCM10025858_29350 [Alicyclobacillus sacchari]|uniref:hypothetical protein n=1 Tax=Alicyclobacillus sacchari TaxID=392010 RepID=UPI0023EA292F|nr:hypothetical protein [Alicyclobacillus sacchari]GMA58432.1 hypothetical protein GCM10025858_29350 [Alicyclobacillus sacchari]
MRVAISAALCEVANDPPTPGVRHPYEKPVVANFLTTGDYRVRCLEVDPEREIPIYPFPEQAVRALAKVIAYHEYRDKDPGVVPELDRIHTEKSRDVILASTPMGMGDEPSFALAWPALSDALAAIGLQAASEPDERAEEYAAFHVTIETDPLFGPLLRLHLSSEERGVAVLRRTVTQTLPAVRLIPLTDADARGIWSEAEVNSGSASMEPHRDTVLDAVLRMSQWGEEVPEVIRADLYFAVDRGKAICVAGHVEVARPNG